MIRALLEDSNCTSTSVSTMSELQRESSELVDVSSAAIAVSERSECLGKVLLKFDATFFFVKKESSLLLPLF